MIDRLRESRIWQIVFIGALIVVLPLVIDINNRLNTIYQMKQEKSRLNQELLQLQAENETLQAQLEFVQSPEYTELWARTQARMILPGQVAVIPLADKNPATKSPTIAGGWNRTPTDLSPTKAWRDLFFGIDNQ